MKTKNPGASAPSSSSASAASHRTADAQTIVWLPKLRAFGEAAAAAGRFSDFEDTLLVSTARRIASIPTDNETLAAALAGEGLGADYFSAMGTFAEQLHQTANQGPPDLRNLELVSPAKRAVIAAAIEHLKTVRRMVFTVALATGRAEECKALGRGLKIGRTFESARIAGRTFLSGAPEHQALLEDAGATQARLDRIAADLRLLDEVESDKADRKQVKGQASTEIGALSLTIEAGFSFFRARAMGAFETDPLGLEAALRYLPRAPERRAAKKPPADKEKTPAGKEKAPADKKADSQPAEETETAPAPAATDLPSTHANGASTEKSAE